MAIRISSNISSLQAQRRLAESSATLSKTYERLSSGQRINRASDDAAGLSIADNLKAGTRVFTQGVRNLNDGISLLQIADSAVSGLSQIVTRIRELAEQAANGSYSSTQRKAMDNEAQALQKEYFRISRSTEFNGTNLFDGSLSNGLRLQGGFGVEGSVQSSLGGVMGDGTFSAKTSFTAGSGPNSVALGDLNGDGVLDMVATDPGAYGASVFIGKGDGTFFARSTYAAGAETAFVTLGDLNGDGVLDMVTADGANMGSGVSVFIGKGDGTFFARATYATGMGDETLALGDLNGDGVLDLVTADSFEGKASVLLGKGDGTFSARTSVAIAGLFSVALGDVNGDGALDMVTSGGDKAGVFIGKGDGTFSAGVSFTTGLFPVSVSLGDLNGDGALDMVTADNAGDTVSILIGKGDGTFSLKNSYTTGDHPSFVTLGDLNGDGALDMVTADAIADKASVFIGKGDGTFSASASFTAGTSPRSVALGDLNGDGVLDLVTADADFDDGGTVSALLGDTREGIAPLIPFSLTTQAGARQAMAPLDRKLSQLAAQRGVLGAFQSRLSVAINTLQSTSENYASAESRIRDTDVASHTAELTRLQISQQAATAVLAQANQAPALAIQLLRGG